MLPLVWFYIAFGIYYRDWSSSRRQLEGIKCPTVAKLNQVKDKDMTLLRRIPSAADLYIENLRWLFI